MDIFSIHQKIIGEYKSFVESFINIKDNTLRAKIEQELQGRKLWPEPLVQFNPSYKRDASVNDLCEKGILHPEINKIFKGYDLYKHQVKALKKGTADEDFIVTSGTGSGKSLTYLGTIFDYVLNNPERKGVKAIIVYPMNALINSQFNEIKKYKSNYESNGKTFPVTFQKYTGQEGEKIRQAVQENKPDIILTNYMMMELILTRNKELGLRNSFKDTLKYLVFDELHTYRGRQGSDVAMQIRRIRSNCKNELVCIGTSATMATGETLRQQREEVAEVANTIFGKDFEESQVIDEEFEPSFKPLGKGSKYDNLRKALEVDIKLENSEQKLSENPIGAWLELEIGLQEKEGKYVRRDPITLTQITKQLSEITGVSVQTCEEQIKKLLEWAEKINVQNEKNDIRKKWLPYKLHQFIAQTGSVHVTMKQPEDRDIDKDIMLDASYYMMDEGDAIPLYPIVFSRMSGHEFLCVKMNESEGQLESRPFSEQTSEEDEEYDLDSGYVVFDHSDELVWRKDDIEYLPDSWKKKNGEVNKKNIEKIPLRIWVNEQGKFSLQEKSGYYPAWYIKSPLPFDPTSGVKFHGSTSEYTKLTKLGSEARSTATSVISQSTIKALRSADYASDASKLLSFTDVRQDASLQAGHFNDFTKTVRLRSAIFHALANAKGNCLDHTIIAKEVFKTLNVREEEYAQDPIPETGFKTIVNKNEEALKKKILYDLLYDLRYGWRVTLPNLEQCGLLKFGFQNLEEFCEQEDGWKNIPGFSGMLPAQRFEIVNNTLDYFRKQYAISHESLDPNSIEKNEREIRNRLNQTWGFDENGRVERANWMRFSPFDRKPSGFPTESIGYLSRLGRYLKERPELENYITGKETYEEVLTSLLEAFSGTYFRIEKVQDRGSGEIIPIYQLKVDAINWKLGDGKTVPPDPINTRSYKKVSNSINTYFRDLYSEQKNIDFYFDGAEHTGQISNEDRQERENQFKTGDINALFCSPTMELGIDIADLNVVHMRNVPPNPANYSQRSGRAGRSGQAALVFTYCANYSPHDRHYFANSSDMVAGKVLPPRMDMQNEELMLSHLNALCLAEVGLNDLNQSIANVLDLKNEEDMPLREDIIEKFKLPTDRLKKVKSLFKIIIAKEVDELEWYSDQWLEDKLNNFLQRFDEKLNRWRSLFKDARAQLQRAQKVLDDPTYKANSSEKRQAKRDEDQARRQINLLKNDIGYTGLSEFYPFRYLASEGFLPGYNFTRLPIRAFMPSKSVSKEGDYLSRPRSIALREFGPGNIVYHNGSTYSVTRMNVNDLTSQLTKAKVAKNSGYILDGEAFDSEICPFTEDRLDTDSSREIITDLVHMGEVQTIPRKRISCDEEERRSRGYEIDTFFKVDGGMDRVRNIELWGEENHLMTMRYIPAANLYFVNRKWRTSADKGFSINLTTGEWVRGNNSGSNSNNGEIEEHRTVQLFVTDTADAIYLHPTSQLGIEYEGVVTLQYALKNAVEQIFQVEPNEIRVELMGDKEQPNILLYEASEGSLGVLKNLAEDPQLFRKVLDKAYEICHFTKDPDAERGLPPASYDDLLSYYNQYDHKIIDRRIIKSALEILKVAEPKVLQKGTDRNYDEQYNYLAQRVDSNSELEGKFLKWMAGKGLKLPDKAQYRLESLFIEADFFYEPNICIFIDGSVHDKPNVRDEDKRKRRALRKAGYQVLVYRYDQSFDKFVNDRPDIFKKAKL